MSDKVEVNITFKSGVTKTVRLSKDEYQDYHEKAVDFTGIWDFTNIQLRLSEVVMVERLL